MHHRHWLGYWIDVRHGDHFTNGFSHTVRPEWTQMHHCNLVYSHQIAITFFTCHNSRAVGTGTRGFVPAYWYILYGSTAVFLYHFGLRVTNVEWNGHCTWHFYDISRWIARRCWIVDNIIERKRNYLPQCAQSGTWNVRHFYKNGHPIWSGFIFIWK